MAEQDSAPEGVDPGDWARALSTVRAHCGWHIAPSRTEELRLDGPGGTLLHLPSLHVTAIASIISDGRPVTWFDWSTNGMVVGAWSNRLGGITATITHGHAELPGVVMAVAKALALAPALAVKETAGPYSVDWGDASATLTDVHMDALAPFTIRHRP